MIWLTAFLVLSRMALAAPCCGGGSAAPAMISGDDQAQISVSLSRGSVIGDAPSAGIPIFRSAQDSETQQVYRINGAVLLSDRWQMGVSVPLVARAIQHTAWGSSSTGIGDARLNFAFEFLPEWGYSEWKPKGYLFLQSTLPTGKSIYEASAQGSVDSTGLGFFTQSLGALLLKKWSRWDVFLIPEIHRALNRSFSDSSTGETLQVRPGWGTSLATGVGYSPGAGDVRLGFAVQPTYSQDRNVVTATSDTTTAYQLSWDATLDATYLWNTKWSATLAYTDQTLFGPAVNSSLSRTLAVSVQHRWER